LKSRFSFGEIDKEEYMSAAKRIRFCFFINISYLIIILIQFVYVIYNWENQIEI
jgi:hypothetical protein